MKHPSSAGGAAPGLAAPDQRMLTNELHPASSLRSPIPDTRRNWTSLELGCANASTGIRVTGGDKQPVGKEYSRGDMSIVQHTAMGELDTGDFLF